MDERRREFLAELLETPSPSGFEAAGQRVWTDYVRAFADEVRTDAHGNAVAVHEGAADAERLLSFTFDRWNVFVRADGRIRVCDGGKHVDPAPVFE